MPTWVKICGCTRWGDVELAIEAGADAFGMIFAPSSRRITDWAAADIARRLDGAPIQPVAVLVNPEQAEVARVRRLLPGALVQFSGNESAAFVDAAGERAIKAIHVGAQSDPVELAGACERYEGKLILFDTKRDGAAGGTGTAFDWELVADIARVRPVVIAGGLTPENVAGCVRAVRPYGVDVRSGVETQGSKDRAKIGAFVRAVRAAQ